MSAAKLVVDLVVLIVLLAGLAWAAASDGGRLDGRLPDSTPVVSIDQPRGTVLDALSALSKQAGWSLTYVVQTMNRSRDHAVERILEKQLHHRVKGRISRALAGIEGGQE